jgi:hypothetical protein
MSNDTDTRVVAARIIKNGGSVSANTTIASWTSASVDTHGAMNLTSGVYTVPVSGIYYVELHTLATVAGGGYGRIVVDGVTIAQNAADEGPNQAGYGVSGLTATLNAGQQITVQLSVSKTLTSNNTDNILTIHRLSGPSAIAASETVAARYKTSAGQSIPNNSSTIVDFGTRDIDTHGAVTVGASWKFTAPVAGKYRISAAISSTSGGGWASGEEFACILSKNGAAFATFSQYAQTTHSTFVISGGSTIVDLVSGDYVDVRNYQNSGGALALRADANANSISIERIGN